ncbi:hypothetical protein PHYSODRAFT_331291 [Phytophthora sojae]|uniref:RxLR effector protein n=1 Tax=Phytophthora sojae (strain P6497) TaxID=1094619 RepID=G4ZJ52_PHYSP|nr:hypothetical protein PHYSODRAFT_331291 [Phytophthora sojae]EGZ17299.1 hypothetical protein PHYSODRAFT_331291 [Phytophthora sojae]|eukprot:XP_009526357.1 hypothetical protein PHYSODRAFT_331291 [Phytophthora sojae]
MRAYNAFLVTTVVLLTTSNFVSAGTNAQGTKSGQRHLRSDDKNDADAASVHEDRDGLFSLPEELEELVETHHHIREIFTRWCLEKKEPKEAEEEAKSEKEAKYAKLYKLYMNNAAGDKDRRKLEVKGLECNLLKNKES